VALLGLGACAGDSSDVATGERIIELTDLRPFEGDEALNGVRSLAVDATGDVWVLASSEPYVHRYDSTGKLVASFGRAGQGPGELQPSHEILAPTESDPHVVVWSAGSGTLTRYERDGIPAARVGPVLITRSVPTIVEQLSFARAIPMARWRNGFLLQDQRRRDSPGLESTMSLANAALVVLDSVGTQIDTLIEFRQLTGFSRPGATVADLGPLPLWTVCPNGSAVVVDPYGMRLRRFDRDGRAAPADTLPLDAPPITDADIERWLRNSTTVSALTGGRAIPESVIEEYLKAYLAGRRGELATIGPPAVRAQCDEDSNIWLQRYNTADEPRGLGREWVVVSEGRIIRSYRFPPRFQPMALHTGTAFGVVKDSMDVERVAAVRYAKQ
jgi:hypothetical protein